MECKHRWNIKDQMAVKVMNLQCKKCNEEQIFIPVNSIGIKEEED